MANKLSDILKQEYKTKGLVGGLSSALGKSALEKIDIRNLLFSGSGVGAMIGQKAFGKGYSATRRADTQSARLSTAELSTTPTNVLNEQSLQYLDQISINTKISAKNSLALPSMARDMHLVKQNIAKLVKLQGGTPTTKAGDWFSRQAAREAAFESKYNKTSPSKMSSGDKAGKPESGGGLLGSLLGAGSLLGLIFSPLNGVIKGLTGTFGGLVKILGGISLSLLRFGGVIGRILLWLVKSKVGRLLGLAGVLMMGKKAMAGTTEGDTEEGGGFGFPDINDDTTIFDSNKMGNSVDESVSNFKQSGTGNYAAGAVAAVGAARFGAAALRLGTTTGATILDVRTQSIGQLTKASPKSLWGRFLQFLARRNSKLFAQVALRLAQATTLAAIPVVGWIGALIQLGFTLWTAWEIYELWREFIKDEDESTANTSKAPTGVTTKETGNEARVTADNTQTAAAASNLTPASQSTQNMTPQQRGDQANSNNVTLDTRIRNVRKQIEGLPPGKQRDERQRVLDGLLREKNTGEKYNPSASPAPSEDPLDIRIESLQRQIDALPNGPARDILKKTQQELKIRKAGKNTATPINQPGPQTPTPVTKQDMADLIRRRFKEAGFSDVQAEAAVANAIAESGLDPSLKSRAPGEDSWGLFQLNRNGGEGAGHTPEQLQDPETNIKIAIDAMKKPDQGRRFRAATTIPEAVSAFVQDFERPSDQSVAAINRRIEIANNNRGSVIDGASTAIAAGGRGGINNVYADNSVTTNNVNNGGGGSSGSAEIADFDFLQLIGAARS